MNTKEQTKKNTPSKEVKNVFKQMLKDKNVMRSYIQKNGTLNGFKDESIIFAKPL